MADDQGETSKGSNEEWEDVEEEDVDGPQSGKLTTPSHDEIQELSSKNSALFV